MTRFSRPARATLLFHKGQLRAPLRTIAQGLAHERGFAGVNVDDDVANTRLHNLFNHMLQHGLVGKRNEMFIASPCDGAQARVVSARRNESFHNCWHCCANRARRQ